MPKLSGMEGDPCGREDGKPIILTLIAMMILPETQGAVGRSEDEDG